MVLAPSIPISRVGDFSRTEVFDAALLELGAGASLLTREQKRELDELGYTVFPGLMDDGWREALCQRFEELMAQEGERAGVEVHQEKGTRRLSNLVNKGAVFDRVWTHPLVLSAVRHVIGRAFKLSSLNARDALPGQGTQGFHTDWDSGWTYTGEFHVCNSIWMLDDFTEQTGCTRIVLGTHRLPIAALADASAAHPEQALVAGPAGTVAVFNSHLWHSGTKNTTDRPRRGIHCYYTAREHTPQTDQQRYLLSETSDRLSSAALHILGID
ncbi:MAG TPA: phytanoyl-CoA dioxygenase family protein [Polyangiaceae bacterium]|jgi:ectoine hydroxylase-related dioxygenase (phytanoyl-CoA dioxygenase family)